MKKQNVSQYDKDEEAILKIIAESQEIEDETSNAFQELCESNGYKVRVGRWKWVNFKDGYCVFDPHIIVNGKKVIPQEIHIKNSNEMMNEYAKRYGKKLLSFDWAVDEHNKAIVDDIFIVRLKNVADKFIQLEYKDFIKRYGKGWFKLNWEDVSQDLDFFDIQPNIGCPKLPSVRFQVGSFGPTVEDMIKYSDRLPGVPYKIFENFSGIEVDWTAFCDAIEACEEILTSEYGDKWIEERKKEYGNVIILPPVTSDDENWEEELLGVADKLRHKVVDKSIFDEEFELQWDDVKFFDGYYIFEPNMENRAKRLRIEPLRIENFKCRRSFMRILGHFKNQMLKITYRITKDFKIKINSEPDFEKALVFLAKENRLRDIDEFEHIDTPRRFNFNEAMERAESKSPEELIKKKTSYFDFLIAHQMKGYRVVPVTESLSYFRGKHVEDSFMFTLKSHDGQLFIVVENENIKRATMVFKASAEKFYDALRAVFEYVQSDVCNKRSTVRGGRIDFKNTGVTKCKSIDHDGFDEWKRCMTQYFR